MLVRCYCEKLPLISGYRSNHLLPRDDLTPRASRVAGECRVASRISPFFFFSSKGVGGIFIFRTKVVLA